VLMYSNPDRIMTLSELPGRTEIYRHFRRDLVHATRKIRCANEPVMHDKHQPCNSNYLQCPIYAL